MAWQFDPNALSFDEIQAVCHVTGTNTLKEFLTRASEVCSDLMEAPIDDAAAFTAAIVWLSKRETDPAFTFEEARKMPMGEMNAYFEGIAEGPAPVAARARPQRERVGAF